MPVQRVPRYKVFIEELIKVTPDDFRDKDLLSRAFVAIDDTAAFINDTIRFKEGLTSVSVLVETPEKLHIWLNTQLLFFPLSRRKSFASDLSLKLIGLYNQGVLS